MGKQKKKEVLRKLSDLSNSINKSKYSKMLNATMHFDLLCIYFVFTMKIKYITTGFHWVGTCYAKFICKWIIYIYYLYIYYIYIYIYIYIYLSAFCINTKYVYMNQGDIFFLNQWYFKSYESSTDCYKQKV